MSEYRVYLYIEATVCYMYLYLYSPWIHLYVSISCRQSAFSVLCMRIFAGDVCLNGYDGNTYSSFGKTLFNECYVDGNSIFHLIFCRKIIKFQKVNSN